MFVCSRSASSAMERKRKGKKTDFQGSETSRPSWGCSHRPEEEERHKEREHHKEKGLHNPEDLLEEGELPIPGFAEAVVVATSY